MRVFAIAAAILLVGLTDAGAQTVTDPVFARAQTLVSEGQGAQGRALVDSMYRLSAPASAERVEALFWRATLAATAADAERDYRAIIVDHATSARVEDALLRLAQLELARGDRDGALRHLQRLSTEFPGSRYGARTNYWTARVLFEKGDLTAACAANSEALTRVAVTDIELKNQIEYQQQRCRGAATVAATTTPAPAVTTPRQQPAAPPQTPRDATPSIPLDTRIDPAPAARTRSYSVQVAAANTRATAQSIVNRMQLRGYQARIVGTSAPFRVRVGSYATRDAATRAMNEMKAKGIEGFVAVIDAH